MSFAFKKFSFFQQHEIKSHGVPAAATCYCAGGGLLFVGCDGGAVAVLDDAFQLLLSFPAHAHKTLHMVWAEVGGGPAGRRRRGAAAGRLGGPGNRPRADARIPAAQGRGRRRRGRPRPTWRRARALCMPHP
jgi:hypothetical protein